MRYSGGMRFIKQFTIIIAISFCGEILNRLIPLPVPASIYGLVIMLLCLHLHIIKVPAVKETATFLIEIMPVLFVAPGVAILGTVPMLKKCWWQLLIVTVVSTILVMVVTGHVTQAIIRLRKKSKGDTAHG